MLIDSVDVNKCVSEKFLKRLEELSIKSLGEVPQLDQLTKSKQNGLKRE